MVSGLMLVTFVVLVAYALATESGHIAKSAGRVTPQELTKSQLFKKPGVEVKNQGAGGTPTAEVHVLARTWNFNPAEIILPVGAQTTFYATSEDILHGFQIQHTNVNIELIPGEIATFKYTFDKPGEYQVICNEYCGISHQNMLGVVKVLGSSEFAAATAPSASAVSPAAIGEGVYNANCAACHQAEGQGLEGNFPPLAAHAADLYKAERNFIPHVLLFGMEGEINVKGVTYNGQMPNWDSALSDEEIAYVSNHILESWGNKEALPKDFKPYTPKEIAAVRKDALTPQDVHQARVGLNLP